MFTVSYFLRVLAFSFGLVIAAGGIATVTSANLGTTPITCIPLVLNHLLPMTVGVYTAIFSMLLILAQKLILGPNFRYTALFQIPASLLLSVAIDFWLWFTSFVTALPYAYRLGFLALGIVLLATGIFIQVLSDVCIMPGDGLVLAITCRFNCVLGNIKVLVDSSMVATAACIGYVFLREFVGIREGTLCAAIFVGMVIRFEMACLDRLGLLKHRSGKGGPARNDTSSKAGESIK